MYKIWRKNFQELLSNHIFGVGSFFKAAPYRLSVQLNEFLFVCLEVTVSSPPTDIIWAVVIVCFRIFCVCLHVLFFHRVKFVCFVFISVLFAVCSVVCFASRCLSV